MLDWGDCQCILRRDPDAVELAPSTQARGEEARRELLFVIQRESCVGEEECQLESECERVRVD